MALFVEGIVRDAAGYKHRYSFEWHVSEPVPEDLGRVVTFQADGDELNLFQDAMVASHGDDPKVQWTKFMRFENRSIQFPNDPCGVVVATLTLRDGTEVPLTQKALDRLTNAEPTVVYGELAEPSNH